MVFPHSLTSLAWWKSFFTPDGYSADDIPDLAGKVAIVTGANTGLGYATAAKLAAQRCKVFLACRSKERALEAMDKIKKEVRGRGKSMNDDQLEFLHLDLANMQQCHEAALTFLGKGLPLHILTNNAGIGNRPFSLVDGIECHMAINHFGHFAFTIPLLDRLVESQTSRVVVVSSILHEASGKGVIDFERVNDPDPTIGHHIRYGQSKAANILFAKALARRMAEHKVYVNAVHVGMVRTNIMDTLEDVGSKQYAQFLRWVQRSFGYEASKGALTSLYCATSPEIEKNDIRGAYYIPVAKLFQSARALESVELQEKLWDYSEKLLASRLDKDNITSAAMSL